MAFKQLQLVTTNRDSEWPTSQSCHCHAASSIIYTVDSRMDMDVFSGNT